MTLAVFSIPPQLLKISSGGALRRRDGYLHNARGLRIGEAVFDVFDILYDTILVFASVRGFLSWRLIWTDSGLLIYLRAGVQQDNFGGDVAADGFAVAEKGDAGFIRSVAAKMRFPAES
jgi:hypothetical protein